MAGGGLLRPQRAGRGAACGRPYPCRAGRRGRSGLDPGSADERYRRSGCVTADRDLMVAILTNPSGHYFNVRLGDFPAGALRGQLTR